MCHLYCHLVCTGFTHPGSHQILENLRCTFGWICLCLALLGGSHSDLNEKTWDLGFPGTSPVDRDSFFSFSFDRVQKHLASSWKLVHGWGKWLVNCETTFENFMDFMLEIRHEPTSPRPLCLVALLERVLFLRSLALEITATRSPSWSASVIFYNTWKAGRRSHASLLGQWIFWGDLKIYTRLPNCCNEKEITAKWQWNRVDPQVKPPLASMKVGKPRLARLPKFKRPKKAGLEGTE